LNPARVVSGVPSVRFVGAVQLNVADPVGPACTVIVNAASDAEAVPLLTEIVMLAYVPTLAAVGVPDSWPVVVLNDAQEGMFAIEKVSDPPLGLVVVGVKE
jgi:hypothetical protein